MNFWQKLKESKNGPILCLAPMADVTDRAFRRIIAKYSSNSYVTWTEFVSADGLFSGGYDALINDLSFSEEERPIVAQFFTSKPEMMEKAAKLAVELGFDRVDINMGCPDKNVEKQGAGAALIKNPKLAQEIILAAKQGSGDLPVSVKTRIGYNKNELEEWLPKLLETKPAVITIHARTRKEMSDVPARWEYVKRAVEIRNSIENFSSPQVPKSTDIFLLKNSSCSPQSGSQASSELMGSKNSLKTLIFGNGDVVDTDDAKRKCEETKCDGVMLGRAIFGNPWLFADYKPTMEEKLKVLVEHSKLFEKLVQPKTIISKAHLRQGYGGQGKSFAVMKKHFKAYLSCKALVASDVSGWDARPPERQFWRGVKDLRMKLMEAENAKEVEKIVKDFLK